MKEDLCRAFCNEVSVTEVPVGLAVRTPFRRIDGDAIAFYVIKNPAASGIAHLEDDGQTIPYLEACGVDFETQTRHKALEELLEQYGAEYDEEENVIKTKSMRESDLPQAALRFAALLLRMFDFLLLSQAHVESTFKDDAAKRIREAVGSRATIQENEPVSENLTEVMPDMILRAPGREPVAIFLSQSAARVHEAIFLQMAALYEAKESVSVVALLEKETTLPHDMHRRARNRLGVVASWEGDQTAAIQRIEREVLGAASRLN